MPTNYQLIVGNLRPYVCPKFLLQQQNYILCHPAFFVRLSFSRNFPICGTKKIFFITFQLYSDCIISWKLKSSTWQRFRNVFAISIRLYLLKHKWRSALCYLNLVYNCNQWNYYRNWNVVIVMYSETIKYLIFKFSKFIRIFSLRKYWIQTELNWNKI